MASSFRLTFMQDSSANEQDYVELGLSCADACQSLDQWLDGRGPDELDQSVLHAIEQFIG